MAEPARPCPICGKHRAAAHAPFCSPHCRDRDLLRWFSDSYAVPGQSVPATEAEQQADTASD